MTLLLFGGLARAGKGAKPQPAVMRARLGAPLKVGSSKIGRQEPSGRGRSTQVPSDRECERERRPAAVVICQSTTWRLQVAACVSIFESRLAYRFRRLSVSPRHATDSIAPLPHSHSHSHSRTSPTPLAPIHRHVCPSAANGPTSRRPLRSIQARPFGYV